MVPTMDETGARQAIVTIARMMSDAGLAEAFGHVSIRWGGGFLITSTLPFSEARPSDVVHVPDPANPPSGGGDTRLETPMHAAVYAARADIGAICRGHPPAVVQWGVGTEAIPLLHGLGALAGAHVRVHDDVHLISSLEQGTEVAQTLGDDSAVVLRANGCFAVGATPLEALTRLYFLEERTRIALNTTARDTADWQRRMGDTAAELTRAMAWVEATFAPA